MTVTDSQYGSSGCSPNYVGSSSNNPTLSGLQSWEVSTGIGLLNLACATWNTTQDWSVTGYSPSGYTWSYDDTTPAHGYTSGGTLCQDGNIMWYYSGGGFLSTGETCTNLTPSGSYTSASSFNYAEDN